MRTEEPAKEREGIIGREGFLEDCASAGRGIIRESGHDGPDQYTNIDRQHPRISPLQEFQDPHFFVQFFLYSGLPHEIPYALTLACSRSVGVAGGQNLDKPLTDVDIFQGRSR